MRGRSLNSDPRLLAESEAGGVRVQHTGQTWSSEVQGSPRDEGAPSKPTVGTASTAKPRRDQRRTT